MRHRQQRRPNSANRDHKQAGQGTAN